MQQNFQINLRGIIELLSNHLHSGPNVVLPIEQQILPKAILGFIGWGLDARDAGRLR